MTSRTAQCVSSRRTLGSVLIVCSRQFMSDRWLKIMMEIITLPSQSGGTRGETLD